MISIDEEEIARQIAGHNGFRPKPSGMSIASWSMGQRQIVQAKAQGRWGRNNYQGDDILPNF